MAASIKDHPLHIRLQRVPAKEAAGWVLGDVPLAQAGPKLRKQAFRRVAKSITAGAAERKKYGFSSDPNGEISQAMEWAYQCGVKAGRDGSPPA